MLLSIEELSVAITTKLSAFPVIERFSLSINKGEVLGLVGESGSGKSMLASAIMGSFPTPEAHVTHGTILFDGEDLGRASRERYREVRGNKISIILQDSLAALNPVLRINTQVEECVLAHNPRRPRSLSERVLLALQDVAFPTARLRAYPHQLSGGMRQRVAAGMALVNRPNLLIADEPTTALDVTVQAQFLRLLARLNEEHKMAVLLISHDLAVVAQVASSIAVMYAGRLMEHGPASQVLEYPKHPYTKALLDAIPRVDQRLRRLPTIQGFAPPAYRAPTGCPFRDRCQWAIDICTSQPPLVSVDGSNVACWLYRDAPAATAAGSYEGAS